jgi:hypothetical protein
LAGSRCAGTIITTIGYGNMAPLKFEGKLLTMVYALIGIPLMLFVLSRLGAALVTLIWTVWTRARIYIHFKLGV